MGVVVRVRGLAVTSANPPSGYEQQRRQSDVNEQPDARERRDVGPGEIDTRALRILAWAWHACRKQTDSQEKREDSAATEREASPTAARLIKADPPFQIGDILGLGTRQPD